MKALRILILIAFTPLFTCAQDTDTTGKAYFFKAKQQLEDMLSGKTPMSYEEAIYQIENAWWNGGVSYTSFKKCLASHESKIRSLAKACEENKTFKPVSDLLQTKEQKIQQYQKAIINYAIYRYITSFSVWIKDNHVVSHQPYEYITSDPMGTTDWTNTHVSKLINENTGNCFALASLFKIFSERLNSEAKLCTAPGHIYIRHADIKGTYYNVELASHAFPGTGTIETLTYTPDEATKNNIALRELDSKQSVALCLVYLAKGYEYKFNNKDDAFILSCAETALQYDDHNLNAMLLKAEVLEQRLTQQKKSFKQLQNTKEFKQYQQWITYIFKLGYLEMPFEMKNILIKGWTRDTIMQLATIDHIPQHSTNTNITPTRYASLSWGLFDEEIHTKPLERFSNTVFDTKTQTIIAFMQNDVLYNHYNFDPVVFAWSVDPLAHKFPSQSPYSAFGNNPIYNIDVEGALQYPADLAAGYRNTYPMITKYLAENVQKDIQKSSIVQNAIVKNTYGGYTKDELVNNVAKWGNKNSPQIIFVQGLTKKTGGATAYTPDAKHIQIDAEYAKTIDNILADKKYSIKDKQAAITKFYQTIIDEVTHTGDLKDGYKSSDEVGGDAKKEIFYNRMVKLDNGETVPIDWSPGEIDVDNAELSGTKMTIDRKTQEGQTEVIPTVPQ